MPEEHESSCEELDVPAELCKELSIDFKVLHPDKLQFSHQW